MTRVRMVLRWALHLILFAGCLELAARLDDRLTHGAPWWGPYDAERLREVDEEGLRRNVPGGTFREVAGESARLPRGGDGAREAGRAPPRGVPRSVGELRPVRKRRRGVAGAVAASPPGEAARGGGLQRVGRRARPASTAGLPGQVRAHAAAGRRGALLQRSLRCWVPPAGAGSSATRFTERDARSGSIADQASSPSPGAAAGVSRASKAPPTLSQRGPGRAVARCTGVAARSNTAASGTKRARLVTAQGRLAG